MKKHFSKIVLLAIMVAGFASCTRKAYVVQSRPPAPVVRVHAAGPSPRHIWISGDYIRRGNKYIWREGYWIVPSNGRQWVDGYWKDNRRGWVWVPGHWR